MQPTDNVIGPIDQDTWTAMRNARGAIKSFRKDPEKYKDGLVAYERIYKDTLSSSLRAA